MVSVQLKYYRVNIPPNCVIDEIDYYLSRATLAGCEMQTIKTPALDMVIRVSMTDTYSMSAADPHPNTNVVNYVRMELMAEGGRGAQILYYAVKKTRRLANNTAELTLRLDVLNTYFQPATHYTTNPPIWSAISGKSRIKRLHKDRFKGSGSYTASIIDRVAEGISPTLRLKTESGSNINDFKPAFKCGRTDPADFFDCMGWKMVFITPGGTPTKDNLPRMVLMPYGVTASDGLQLEAEDGKTYQIAEYELIDISDSRISAIIDCPVFPLDGGVPPSGNSLGSPETEYSLGRRFYLKSDFVKTVGIVDASTPGYLKNCLVYYPEFVAKDKVEEALVRTAPPTFPSLVHLNGSDDLNALAKSIWEPDLGTIAAGQERHIKDPKLNGSEFGRLDFVFDSQSISINPADLVVDTPTASGARIGCNAVFSLDWSGGYYFQIDPGGDLKPLYQDSPFSYVLQLGRKMQETLINSDYINYMRTGYNYDLKNKDVNMWSNVAATILSTITTVASAALMLVPGAQGISALGIVSGVSGIVGKSTSAIFSDINAQNQIEAKQAGYKAKGAEVTSMNQLDLLRAYQTWIVPLACWYQPSEEMAKMIDNLFYYFGYADISILKDYEDSFKDFRAGALSSRLYFNYCEMEIEWQAVNINPLPNQEILDEIKARFIAGVTFFHNLRGNYDFEQTKENWEVSLL